MRIAVVLVLLGTHACELGRAPLVIPDSHRGEIERQTFTPVARVGDLPPAVQVALRSLPGSSPALASTETAPSPQHGLILLGCAVDHCLVHYEHRGVFYVVLLGMASRVLVEWAEIVSRPLTSLTDVKAAALAPARTGLWSLF